jgi:hypothetical protein
MSFETFDLKNHRENVILEIDHGLACLLCGVG